MTDRSESEPSLLDRWRAANTVVQILVGLVVVGGAAATIFMAGYGVHTAIAERADLPAQVETLRDTVLRDKIPSRVRTLEGNVREIRANAEDRSERLDSIARGVSANTSLLRRVLCEVRGRDICADAGR